ncbi:transmembrane protein, putative (macronuclear) [Tetrahymena thermophila SB210]|uniref:Transmembrane protein, putative n=1 Tax=Tetrahymena thermophila (strain SB210) TaxID=312017 RepID=Q23ZF0_TETTS|nr:transmembrane protein, putative [Tetrahymena thermophila SB210]EAS01907.2 transmembrane protein, putative [Tetrahymena thermophila SB210]|eukprot:XP_001022152.2 transmembrane protein, putative [Tetrahymena thermophila SB210]
MIYSRRNLLIDFFTIFQRVYLLNKASSRQSKQLNKQIKQKQKLYLSIIFNILIFYKFGYILSILPNNQQLIYFNVIERENSISILSFLPSNLTIPVKHFFKTPQQFLNINLISLKLNVEKSTNSLFYSLSPQRQDGLSIEIDQIKHAQNILIFCRINYILKKYYLKNLLFQKSFNLVLIKNIFLYSLLKICLPDCGQLSRVENFNQIRPIHRHVVIDCNFHQKLRSQTLQHSQNYQQHTQKRKSQILNKFQCQKFKLNKFIKYLCMYLKQYSIQHSYSKRQQVLLKLKQMLLKYDYQWTKNLLLRFYKNQILILNKFAFSILKFYYTDLIFFSTTVLSKNILLFIIARFIFIIYILICFLIICMKQKVNYFNELINQLITILIVNIKNYSKPSSHQLRPKNGKIINFAKFLHKLVGVEILQKIFQNIQILHYTLILIFLKPILYLFINLSTNKIFIDKVRVCLFILMQNEKIFKSVILVILKCQKNYNIPFKSTKIQTKQQISQLIILYARYVCMCTRFQFINNLFESKLWSSIVFFEIFNCILSYSVAGFNSWSGIPVIFLFNQTNWQNILLGIE